MTHPSPTALPLSHDDLARAKRMPTGYTLRNDDVTAHIAALEAEMAADKKIKEAVCSQLEIADFANASLALACVQDELKRLQAEAQLATRLPTRAEIEAKFGEWAMTGESTVMKARWMHEWLLSGAATAEQSFDGTIHPDGTPNQVTASTWLSGAATPAPTAALTEEEIHDLIKEHLGAIENTIVGKSEFFAGLMGLLREKGVVKG